MLVPGVRSRVFAEPPVLGCVVRCFCSSHGAPGCRCGRMPLGPSCPGGIHQGVALSVRRMIDLAVGCAYPGSGDAACPLRAACVSGHDHDRGESHPTRGRHRGHHPAAVRAAKPPRAQGIRFDCCHGLRGACRARMDSRPDCSCDVPMRLSTVDRMLRFSEVPRVDVEPLAADANP